MDSRETWGTDPQDLMWKATRAEWLTLQSESAGGGQSVQSA